MSDRSASNHGVSTTILLNASFKGSEFATFKVQAGMDSQAIAIRQMQVLTANAARLLDASVEQKK